MKILLAFLAILATALAIPAAPIAGAAPPTQNYCQIDIKLEEDLPRQPESPLTRLKLKIWDKEKYMDKKQYYPEYVPSPYPSQHNSS